MTKTKGKSKAETNGKADAKSDKNAPKAPKRLNKAVATASRFDDPSLSPNSA